MNPIVTLVLLLLCINLACLIYAGSVAGERATAEEWEEWHHG